jgi:hypothetical protein
VKRDAIPPRLQLPKAGISSDKGAFSLTSPNPKSDQAGQRASGPWTHHWNRDIGAYQVPSIAQQSLACGKANPQRIKRKAWLVDRPLIRDGHILSKCVKTYSLS